MLMCGSRGSVTDPNIVTVVVTSMKLVLELEELGPAAWGGEKSGASASLPRALHPNVLSAFGRLRGTGKRGSVRRAGRQEESGRGVLKKEDESWGQNRCAKYSPKPEGGRTFESRHPALRRCICTSCLSWKSQVVMESPVPLVQGFLHNTPECSPRMPAHHVHTLWR